MFDLVTSSKCPAVCTFKFNLSFEKTGIDRNDHIAYPATWFHLQGPVSDKGSGHWLLGASQECSFASHYDASAPECHDSIVPDAYPEDRSF